MNRSGPIISLADRLLGLPEAVTPHIDVDRDLPVPMPDGVVLLADRYRPRAHDKGPVVLIRTPYGRRGVSGRLLGSAFARRGLQVVLQSVRGMFGSGGEFRPFHHERDDGLATARWLREQPWCDGRLATAGPSYMGHTQWAIGPYLDPPLDAMCPAVTASEFTSTFYPGGTLGLFNLVWWSALLGTQETRRIPPGPRQARRTRRAMATLPVRDADVAAIGGRVGFLQEVVRHGGPGDDFWAAADHSGGVAGLVPPVSMVTGWHDLFLHAQLRDFKALTAAGRPARITIGPWFHGDQGLAKAVLNDAVSWLTDHLTEQPRLAADAARRSPVRVFLQRSGEWRDFARWPPAESSPISYLLRPDGRLGRAGPRPGGPDVFVYDPADPTPSAGGPLLSGRAKQRDQRAVESRSDVAVYTGPMLTSDFDVVGEVRATIHVRVEPGHADLVVRLCDVDRAGRSRNVCDGVLRMRPDEPPAGHGGVRVAEVELAPTGYRFKEGHRMRVQIAGGAFPRIARNHGTGEPVADAVTARTCRFEIHHDPDHLSFISLPFLAPHD